VRARPPCSFFCRRPLVVLLVGRRIGETAAHLVYYVFPMVLSAVVLSIPFALRYRLAYDSCLLSDILNIFIRVVFGQLRAAPATFWIEVLAMRCREVRATLR